MFGITFVSIMNTSTWVNAEQTTNHIKYYYKKKIIYRSTGK